LARLYAAKGDRQKLRVVVQAFRVRYPLDEGGQAGRELGRLLRELERKKAQEADGARQR
jgi:hypothetical protein